MPRIAILIAIVLFISGSSSKVTGETLIAKKAFEVSKPEMLEVTEPKFLEVTEIEFLGVSVPKNLKVSKPKSLKSGRFLEGKYVPAKRENTAYLRCAAMKGFSNLKKCALQALSVTQSEK